VGMITPGPMLITSAFIGYLVAGPMGGIAAALGVFLPVYLFVIAFAPYFRRYAGNLQIKAFVSGVTAAAVGAIAGAAVILGKNSIIDFPTAGIGLTTFLVLMAGKKVPEPALILLAGGLGLILKGF